MLQRRWIRKSVKGCHHMFRANQILRASFVAAVAFSLTACGVRPPSMGTPEVQPSSRGWNATSLADLRNAADSAPAQGLRREAAALDELEQLESQAQRDQSGTAARDAAANRLLEKLATIYAMGATDPNRVDPQWRIARASPPDLAALRQAIEDGVKPSVALNRLLPQHPDYHALVRELASAMVEPSGTKDANGVLREERIARLRATLERLRWLPRERPTRRIDVYVPLQELRVSGVTGARAHSVIIGSRRTPTPSFTADMVSVTVNPTWSPPASILLGELLPRFAKDPSAMTREGFVALDRAGRSVDPMSINWLERPFPYAVQQLPGPRNALGRIRFDLPNPYHIYLHDTPNLQLFARTERALSHGCIRVADPVRLAADVLADAGNSQAALQSAISQTQTQVLPLKTPLPVYVLYVTALPDDAGTLRFGADVYGRDQAVLRALGGEAQPSSAEADLASSECAPS